LRSFEERLPDFDSRKIRVIAISVDTPEQSQHLRETQGYTFPILSDAKDEVIRRWDLVHPHGGPDGVDIARPAEFLIDSSGKVRWVNLTEDFRVRARPQQVLAAFDGMNSVHFPSVLTRRSDAHGHDDVAVAAGFVSEGAELAGGLLVL
jgi:peroxiredoxin